MSWMQSSHHHSTKVMFPTPTAAANTATGLGLGASAGSTVMNFGGDNFILRGGSRRVISPENEPAWVPLPGHKRSAPDNDIYLDRELGPAPPKQLAVDEAYTQIVLAPGPEPVDVTQRFGNECPWNGEWKQFNMTSAQVGGASSGIVQDSIQDSSQSSTIPMADDEMMLDIQEEFVPGAYSKLEIGGGDGTKGKEVWLHGTGGEHAVGVGKMHDDQNKDSCSDIDSTDSEDHDDVDKKYPKLVVFEGLRDVLSRKQCDDFPLPKSLVNQLKRESSMAMVLWKPPTGDDSSGEFDGSSCARTTASNRKQNLSHKVKPSDADSKEDLMDLSV